MLNALFGTARGGWMLCALSAYTYSTQPHTVHTHTAHAMSCAVKRCVMHNYIPHAHMYNSLANLSADTDLMQLVTAPTKWPPARLHTTQRMRGLLLLNVAGKTDVLASVERVLRDAWRSGQTVWRRLSDHSMEGYISVHIGIRQFYLMSQYHSRWPSNNTFICVLNIYSLYIHWWCDMLAAPL